MAGTDPSRTIFFGGEKLRTDFDRTRGGGPPFEPMNLAQARELLEPQLVRLRSDVAGLDPRMRGEHVVFEATMLPNYLANTHFPEVLLRETGLVPVGARPARGTRRTSKQVLEDQPAKTLLLAGDDRAVERFTTLLSADGLGRTDSAAQDEFRRFFEISLRSPDETVHAPATMDQEERITWEAVLHPGVVNGAPGADARVIEQWMEVVAGEGGEVDVEYLRQHRGLTFVPVESTLGQARSLARFNPLRAMRPMPEMRPIVGQLLRSAVPRVRPVAPPSEATVEADVRVAVFDGGFDPSCQHLRFASNTDLTDEPVDTDSAEHGTAVVSTVMYGHPAEGQQLQAPHAHVDHFRVLPVPVSGSRALYWLLDSIIDNVNSGDFDLVNLSLGPDECVQDDDPHRWTIALDEVAHERDVLFVVAAGNNGDLDALEGLDRIQPPSDMVNGIGVGACDVLHGADWGRASYSAKGPGRSGARVQPLGVCFGGSRREPFLGMLNNGELRETMGTSFAAPLATHGIARLGHRIGSIRNAHTLRALAVHHADRPNDTDLIDDVGFGRLQHDYDDVLNPPANVATVIYQDRIKRFDDIWMPLPVPTGFMKGDVELRWTISFLAPIDAANLADYTGAAIEVQFRPHTHKRTLRKDGQTREIDYVANRSQFTSLVNDGWEFSDQPSTNSHPPYRHESVQREEGKWETTFSYRKRMRATSLHQPALTINYLARQDGMLAKAAIPLDYCLVATVVARKDLDLQDAVRSQFKLLTPLTARIDLET